MLPDGLTDIIYSSWYFLTSTLFIALAFFYLSLLALSEKVHVRVHHLPRYFLSLILLQRTDEHYRGKVIDGHSGEALALVTIIIRRENTGKIIFHTKTTKTGSFLLHLPQTAGYTIHLQKRGYHPAEADLVLLPSGEEQHFAILKSGESPTPAEKLLHEGGVFLAFSFEVLLLLSLISAIVLIAPFGFPAILPFLLLSLFNMLLWMLHSLHLHS